MNYKSCKKHKRFDRMSGRWSMNKIYSERLMIKRIRREHLFSVDSSNG